MTFISCCYDNRMQDRITAINLLQLLFGRAPRVPRRLLPDLLAAQNRKIVTLLSPMASINVVNGTLLVAALHDSVPMPRLLPWLFALYCLAGMQMLAARKLSRYKPSSRPSSGRLIRKAENTTFLIGLLWGSAAFLLHTDDPVRNLFVHTVIMGMAAGVTLFTTPLAVLASRFILGAVPCIWLSLFFFSNPIPYTTLGLTTTLTLAVLFGSLHNYRAAVGEISMRRLSEDRLNLLTSALETSQDAIAVLDETGALAMANQAHRQWDLDGRTGSAVQEGAAFTTNGVNWFIRHTSKTDTGATLIVDTNITARKELEQRIEQQSAELEKARRSMLRMLENTRHEMLQPISDIVHISTAMVPNSNIALSPDELRSYAGLIHASARQSLSMLEDLLLAVTRSSMDNIPRLSMDLNATVTRAIHALDRNGDGESSRVRFHDSEGPLEIASHNRKIPEKLVDLVVTMALQAHPSQPVIVRTARIGGKPALIVRDNGEPYDPEEAARPTQGIGEDRQRTVSMTLAEALCASLNATLLVTTPEGAGTVVSIVFNETPTDEEVMYSPSEEVVTATALTDPESLAS